MNIWENAVITNKGRALLAKLIDGNTLSITRAVVGAGSVTPGLLLDQTDVTDAKQAISFTGISYPEEGKCALSCNLRNGGLEIGYTAMQVGIFATDPEEGEILFFIAQATAGTGTEIPSESEMGEYSAEWTFYFKYGQANGVDVMVDPAAAVSQAKMEAFVKEYFEEHVNSALDAQDQKIADAKAPGLAAQAAISAHTTATNPHGVTAAQVGLGNVNNTSDASKPVSTAQAAAIADAKAAGTTAQGNLDKHTASKENPHAVTKSQVGLGNVPNVSTNDQTPTYTAATTLATLASGEKLSVSMGKIMKAITDFIAHLANKNNPHSVTANQVGARPNTWMPTASDVGAVPTTRKVNGKTLGSDITLSASDVGADTSGSATQALKDAKSYTDQKVSSIPTPDVSGQINSHNTSTSAHSDIRNAANAALPKSGGTMTGKLTLDGNPTSALHAAPKQYVDSIAAKNASVTLTASAWTMGTDGRYRQTVSVSNVTTSTKVVLVDVDLSTTDMDAKVAYLEAWALPSANEVTQGNGSLTFYAWEVPASNIPVNVGVM